MDFRYAPNEKCLTKEDLKSAITQNFLKKLNSDTLLPDNKCVTVYDAQQATNTVGVTVVDSSYPRKILTKVKAESPQNYEIDLVNKKWLSIANDENYLFLLSEDSKIIRYKLDGSEIPVMLVGYIFPSTPHPTGLRNISLHDGILYFHDKFSVYSCPAYNDPGRTSVTSEFTVGSDSIIWTGPSYEILNLTANVTNYNDGPGIIDFISLVCKQRYSQYSVEAVWTHILTKKLYIFGTPVRVFSNDGGIDGNVLVSNTGIIQIYMDSNANLNVTGTRRTSGGSDEYNHMQGIVKYRITTSDFPITNALELTQIGYIKFGNEYYKDKSIFVSDDHEGDRIDCFLPVDTNNSGTTQYSEIFSSTRLDASDENGVPNLLLEEHSIRLVDVTSYTGEPLLRYNREFTESYINPLYPRNTIVKCMSTTPTNQNDIYILSKTNASIPLLKDSIIKWNRSANTYTEITFKLAKAIREPIPYLRTNLIKLWIAGDSIYIQAYYRVTSTVTVIVTGVGINGLPGSPDPTLTYTLSPGQNFATFSTSSTTSGAHAGIVECYIGSSGIVKDSLYNYVWATGQVTKV